MFNLNNAAKIQLLQGKTWSRRAGNGGDEKITAQMMAAGLVTKTVQTNENDWVVKVYTLTDTGEAMMEQVGREIMEMAVEKTTTSSKRINELVNMIAKLIEGTQSSNPRRARRAASALQSYCTAWNLS